MNWPSGGSWPTGQRLPRYWRCDKKTSISGGFFGPARDQEGDDPRWLAIKAWLWLQAVLREQRLAECLMLQLVVLQQVHQPLVPLLPLVESFA
jgi:hypothetical protein